jgi:hypothetical protein
MCAISNRVRNGWGTWLQVIDRIPAFMAENEIPPLEHPPVWDATFIRLLQTVDGIFDGSVPDKVKGAMYFADLSKIERPWFLEKIVQATKIDQNGCLIPAHGRVANTNGLCFWE